MGLIDSPENGATEIPGSSNDSLIVFLANPIRFWWTEGMWGSPLHLEYTKRRARVHEVLSDNFLVFAPNLAWRGPWDKRAQLVNNYTISISDVFVWLSMKGVPGWGTDEELQFARDIGKPAFELPVDDTMYFADMGILVQKLHVIDGVRKSNG